MCFSRVFPHVYDTNMLVSKTFLIPTCWYQKREEKIKNASETTHSVKRDGISSLNKASYEDNMHNTSIFYIVHIIIHYTCNLPRAGSCERCIFSRGGAYFCRQYLKKYIYIIKTKAKYSSSLTAQY